MIRTGPDLRGFARWLRRVLRTMKDERGWGIVRVAAEAHVPRSTLTRWRDEDWEKGIPTRRVVTRFCDNLGVKKDDPFGYMGWTMEAHESAADAGAEEITEDSELVRRIRLIELALDQPGLAPERRRELDLILVTARRILDPVWDGVEDELRREA